MTKGLKMKKLLLLALASAFAMGGDFTTNENIKGITSVEENKILCKTAIKYAHAYSDTMSKDEASQAMLDIYKKDVVQNCGKISSARAS